MNQEEHNLQCACVKWFAYQHPELQGLLFAIPNGGARNKATAGKLKAEGVVAGVADLILLVPRNKYHGLCIEMKTEKGRQSPEQKGWMEMVEAKGYRYIIIRSLELFINSVEHYLERKPLGYIAVIEKESGESPRPVGSHD